MQAFKRNILQHMLAVGYWMQTRQASGGMDPATATLELSRAGRTLRLTPQFVVEGAGGPITYVPRLQSGVSGFVGWLPYYNRQWPHATHKLAFKEHLQRAGLRTPAWGVGPAQPGVAYLVKAQQSTFGRGMRGPLPASHPVALAEGEYWEAFVPGALVKAWYWGGALQVAEVIDPPRVQGDGQQTVAQLASQLLGPAAVAHMSLDLLALQGLTPDSVPPAKGVVGLDYRYLSPLSPAMVADHNVRALRKRAPFLRCVHPTDACCDADPRLAVKPDQFAPDLQRELPCRRNDKREGGTAGAAIPLPLKSCGAIARPKATVFPDPVCAETMRSRPSASGSSTAACTGVGAA